MQRIADRVLVIFPFEEEIYQRAGVPVEWVGHPLLDSPASPEPRGGVSRAAGARPGAAGRGAPAGKPYQRSACHPARVARRRADHPRRVCRPRSSCSPARRICPTSCSPVSDQHGLSIATIENATDGVLASADVALLASGTVTVQAALAECPMVVVYRLSSLTYRLGRPFVRVNTFAMANLVAGRGGRARAHAGRLHARGGRAITRSPSSRIPAARTPCAPG